MRIKLPPKLRCLRCGHRWMPRQTVVRLCPSCKSAGWETKAHSNQGKRTDLKEKAS